MNQSRTINGFIVQKTRIIGTTCDVYSVWEAYADHSTLTFDNHVQLGRVGCRKLPSELEALKPMSDERYNAVKAWHLAQYSEAYTLIRAAYPEVDFSKAKCDMGQIETW